MANFGALDSLSVANVDNFKLGFDFFIVVCKVTGVSTISLAHYNQKPKSTIGI